MNLEHDELPYARIPLHTVIELVPRAYGCEEKLYKGKIAYTFWGISISLKLVGTNHWIILNS